MTSRASPRLRLFAALELPNAIARALGQAIANLRAAAPHHSVRWVRPEGIHLTLKFYGEVAADRLPEIQASLAQAAATATPIAVRVEGLGVFPSLSRPRVLWAGVEGDVPALCALQAAVEEGAAALGFRTEGRDFTPHLTLGRVNERQWPADQAKLTEALAQSQALSFGSFVADHISLVRSELKPLGPVYTQLFAAPLNERIE